MNDSPPQRSADLKDRVLGKIRRGEVSMHSQLYFALRIAALLLVVFSALAVSIFLCTFIIFTVRVNLQDALTHTGPSGWWFFARFFPWHLLILDIALLALTEWLLRGFRFGYRSPTLYLLFALVAFAIATALFLDRDAGFNDRMLTRAHMNGLPPPLNDMYIHAHRDDLFPPPPPVILMRH